MVGIIKDIIDEDRQALYLINSDKWKEFGDYFGSFSEGMSKKNMNHSLLLNLAKDKHACKRECEYCNWRKHPFSQKWHYPGFLPMQQFLKGFLGYKVTVSGAGDPLYDYEQHNHLIEELTEGIKSLGYLSCLITREYELAASADVQNQFFQISFSVDGKNGDAWYALKDIYCRKIVTIVYDPSKPLTFYKDIYDYYAPVISHMIIRQDMNELEITNNELFKINEKRKVLFMLFRATNARVQYLPAEACLEAYYLLGKEEYIGNELFRGS